MKSWIYIMPLLLLGVIVGCGDTTGTDTGDGGVDVTAPPVGGDACGGDACGADACGACGTDACGCGADACGGCEGDDTSADGGDPVSGTDPVGGEPSGDISLTPPANSP